MVGFTLTDEQKALREFGRDFTAKKIRPVAWDYDRDGAWPQELFEKAHENASSDLSGRRTRAKRLIGDHSQLVQLECLRRGVWGTKSLWGRVVTYPGG
jgi:hypothetical protein